tara:strand:+ start:4063 stop:4317 length:255 start_codon:yes stop_codon:yes gene_type:complete
MNINENKNPKEKNDSEEVKDYKFKKESEIIETKDSKLNIEEYELGWNKYAETINGRFAMIGFFAILLIELLSNTSFLSWSGIIN